MGYVIIDDRGSVVSRKLVFFLKNIVIQTEYKVIADNDCLSFSAKKKEFTHFKRNIHMTCI